MKKRTSETSISVLKSEKGIVFPWVLMVAFLLLLLTFASVRQYKVHLVLTESYKSSIYKQHLLDTARKSLQNELRTLPLTVTTHTFEQITPTGQASATCSREMDIDWICKWQLTDMNGKTKLTTTSHDFKQ